MRFKLEAAFGILCIIGSDCFAYQRRLHYYKKRCTITFKFSLTVIIDPIQSYNFDSDFPQILQQFLYEIGLTNSLDSEQECYSK